MNTQPPQDDEAERIRQNNRRMMGRALGIVGIGWAMFGLAAYYGMVVKGKKDDTPQQPVQEEQTPHQQIPQNPPPVVKPPAP